MKQKFLLKTMLLLCALIAGSSSVWATVTWERVTTIKTLTDGGTFIIGYEATANSGVIIPMANTGSATTSAAGFMYSGSTATSGGTGTIDMSTVTVTSSYEVTIGSSTEVSGAIYIKIGDNYLGNTNTKNNCKLFTEQANTTSFTPTIGSNDNFTLDIAANTSGSAYRYLKYNAGSPRFAVYATTPEKIVIYKKVEAAGAATTVSIDDIGITNTNKFVSTAAGTLTAAVTVTATSDAIEGATVTWTSSNTSVATVGESTGVVTLVGEGATTITASYAGKSGEYKSSYAEYELTVTNENPNAVTLWNEDFSSYSADDVPSGGTYSYVCADNGTNITKIYDATMAGGSSPELLVGKNGGSFSATIPLENIVGDMKLKFKSNAYAVTVSTSTEGISISGDATFTTAGEHTVIFTGVTTAKTSVVITFAAGNSSNVRIDDIVLKGSKVVPVTITSATWASFSSAYEVEIPSGVTAYYAQKQDASTVTLKEITGGYIPANTGVVVSGSEGTYTANVTKTGATLGETNLLKPWLTAGTPTDGTYYTLAAGPTFKLSTGGTLAAGKAYLVMSGSSAPALNVIIGENETTSLSEELRVKSEESVYDLQGRRVINPTKGLYIVNGRKVVIK